MGAWWSTIDCRVRMPELTWHSCWNKATKLVVMALRLHGLLHVPIMPLATMTASTVILFFLYWRERRITKRLRSLSRHTARKVLFFPDSDNSKVSESVDELVKYLSSAVNSLDVCVYAISNRKLIDILIDAHQSGVAVRVITDKDQMTVNPSPVEKLRLNGIQVRHNHDSYFMHHKFAVIDGRCLVNGSLNWTQQAVHGNKENIVITPAPDITRQFLKQFNLLWNQFHPKNYCNTDLI